MLEKPIGGTNFGPGRTEDQIKKGKVLLSQLSNFFMPFVKPVATSRAREIIDANNEKSSVEINEQFIADETITASDELVRSWIDNLFLAAGKNKKLDSSSLDDAMLPQFTPNSRKARRQVKGFESLAASTALSVADNYGILRAVRQSLPAGKVLPNAAVEYLKLEGIEVIG